MINEHLYETLYYLFLDSDTTLNFSASFAGCRDTLTCVDIFNIKKVPRQNPI